MNLSILNNKNFYDVHVLKEMIDPKNKTKRSRARPKPNVEKYFLNYFVFITTVLLRYHTYYFSSINRWSKNSLACFIVFINSSGGFTNNKAFPKQRKYKNLFLLDITCFVWQSLYSNQLNYSIFKGFQWASESRPVFLWIFFSHFRCYSLVAYGIYKNCLRKIIEN